MGRDVVPYMPPVVDQSLAEFPFHPHLTGHPVIDHHFWPALPLPPMFNHFAALSGNPLLPLSGTNGTATSDSLASISALTTTSVASLSPTNKLTPTLAMPTFRALLSQYVLANGNVMVDNEQDDERSNGSGSPESSAIYNNNNSPNSTKSVTDLRLRTNKN